MAAVARDVVFMFDHAIEPHRILRRQVTGVITDKGRIDGDAYVLSLGSYSPLLARGLGVKLPIYPVKGYSVTLPIEDHKGRPEIGGVDEANLVAYARLGDRLRLTATADFAGYDTSYERRTFRRNAAGCARSVSRCRRIRQAELLGVPQADDARRPTDPWPMPPVRISISIPARAIWAGPWPRAAGASLATLSPGADPPSTSTGLTIDRY